MTLMRADVEQAVFWRRVFVTRMNIAVNALDEAVAGVPHSVERVQANRALQQARTAMHTAQEDLRLGERYLAEES